MKNDQYTSLVAHRTHSLGLLRRADWITPERRRALVRELISIQTRLGGVRK